MSLNATCDCFCGCACDKAYNHREARGWDIMNIFTIKATSVMLKEKVYEIKIIRFGYHRTKLEAGGRGGESRWYCGH